MSQSDVMNITIVDLEALAAFRRQYPTWWYRIGVCDKSRDFTAAPQAHSPEVGFIIVGNQFDNGFACDHEETLADAIQDVMKQIAACVKLHQTLPEALIKNIDKSIKGLRKLKTKVTSPEDKDAIENCIYNLIDGLEVFGDEESIE